MTRIQKVAVISLAVALFEGGAAALYAQGPGGRAGGPPPGGPGGRFAGGFMLGQLDLSDAQKQQIRDINMRHREETSALQERMQSAMEAQRVAIETVPVNEPLVRAAAQALAVVQADMAVDQARLHADIFSLLTVEQQAKAKQLQEQAQTRLQERRQRAPRQPRGQV